MQTVITGKIYALLAVALLLLQVGAYGTEPERHEVQPEEPDLQYETSSVTTVPYITLRNLKHDEPDEDRFGDERDQARTGMCVLSRKSLSILEPLNQNSFVYIPDSLLKLESVDDIDSSLFWQAFSNANGDARPLLYLHGYNTSLAKACKQSALLQERVRLNNRLLMFSWPSDGAFLNYARDEADMIWSVAFLEATLLQLLEQHGPGGFDAMAHSLGARGLFFALVQLAHNKDLERPLLNQLILTAPDIDADIFKQYLSEIRPLARNITLYASSQDHPLALSREVHGYPRLGEFGDHLENIDGIDIIDVSEAGNSSFSGHLYHLYNDGVQFDLQQLLLSGKSAEERPALNQIDNGVWRLTAP